MFFIKKTKNLVKNFKRKFEERKRKHQELEKECINIQKLPEKVEYNIKLNEIITFWFLFRTWVIILFLVYLWYIAVNSLNLIYAIFTAFILSLALENTISFFSKYIPRWLSIIISYILFFLFLIFWFIILIPFLISYFSEFLNIIANHFQHWQNILQNEGLSSFIQSLHLPSYIEKKLLMFSNDSQIANKIRDFIIANISSIVQNSTEYVKNISSFAINTIWSFVSIVSQIIMVFILAVFFSFEKDKVVYTIATLSQTPKKTAIKLEKLYHQLWEWLKWQVLLWLFIWTSVFLWLLTLSFFGINLKDKFTLSLIAWFMEFIPYLWPILWAVPSLIVGSLTYWFTGFVAVWILFIIIQQIEGLIVPIIMNKALGVSSLLIFIAMLIWLQVMWLVWVILAIPLAVIISLLFEDSLNKK